MFIQSLPEDKVATILNELQTAKPDALVREWDDSFQNFSEEISKKNAKFQLRVDMMTHVSEEVGINLAERIGGPNEFK